MESAGVRLPLRVLADTHGWLLSKWLVKAGASVYRKQRVAVLKSTTTGAIEHALAPRGGTLLKSFVAEGDTLDPSNAPIAEIQFCPHSVVFKGVCAVCGEEAAPAHFAETPSATEGRLPVAYNSEFLSVTRAEAETASSAAARRLFESKRLSLVLDLDHTLVHATDDARAGAILHHSPENVDRSSVFSFTLGPTPDSRMSSLMHLKLRPNLAEFLERVAAKFELHIYTMGSRPYADQVARLIDPDKSLFSGRITSREDFAEGFCNQKSIARLFPCDDSMVLIVDDREDVWIGKTGQSYMPNLIRAEPYSFWDGLHEAYDRASSTHEMQSLPQEHVPLELQTAPVLLDTSSNNEPIKAQQWPDSSATSNQVRSEVSRQKGRDNELGGDATDGGGRDAHVGTADKGVARDAESAQSSEGSSSHIANGKHVVDQEMATRRGSEEPAISTTPRERPIDGNGVVSGSQFASSAADVKRKEEHCPEDGATSATEQALTPEKGDENSQGGKSVVISMGGATTQESLHGGAQHDAIPVFSAELRKIVSGWWEADASSHRSAHLLRLAEILEDCHFRFFNSPDAKGMAKDERPYRSGSSFRAPADVKRILASMRRDVLKDCVITFTGVIPIGVDPRTAPEWILGQRLGAKCSAEYVNGYTTHLVASQHRSAATQKCKEALESDSTFVVTMAWLDDSAVNFERQLELPYGIKVDSRFKSSEEHRSWVEEKYEAAATELRKRDPSLVRETEPEERSAVKRQKTDIAMSHDGSGSGGQSPTGSTAAMHILSGDELGAAMEAVFED